MSHNRNNKVNGLYEAVSLIALVAIVCAGFVVAGWWLFTIITTVMAGLDHLIAVVFNGPHLHWFLLLILVFVLAGIVRTAGYTLFGIWAAIWVCGFAWWQAILLFAPALFVVSAVVIIPAMIIGITKLFLNVISAFGGRR